MPRRVVNGPTLRIDSRKDGNFLKHLSRLAKDPAFLFYYDRFLSGTISMSDAEVGQYIRLMCIQANKGHITKKDMLNICKSYDNDVCLKFAPQPDGTFVNQVLAEIVDQRKAYTESRRNNRKGTKQKKVSSTYVSHMVNVNVDVSIEDKLNSALDEIYLESQKPKWGHVDFDFELESFREKVRGSPAHYAGHDTGGIRLAFQSQLRNAKSKKTIHNGKPKAFEI